MPATVRLVLTATLGGLAGVALAAAGVAVVRADDVGDTAVNEPVTTTTTAGPPPSPSTLAPTTIPTTAPTTTARQTTTTPPTTIALVLVGRAMCGGQPVVFLQAQRPTSPPATRDDTSTPSSVPATAVPTTAVTTPEEAGADTSLGTTTAAAVANVPTTQRPTVDLPPDWCDLLESDEIIVRLESPPPTTTTTIEVSDSNLPQQSTTTKTGG